jgi:hypothetical protein
MSLPSRRPKISNATSLTELGERSTARALARRTVLTIFGPIAVRYLICDGTLLVQIEDPKTFQPTTRWAKGPTRSYFTLGTKWGGAFHCLHRRACLHHTSLQQRVSGGLSQENPLTALQQRNLTPGMMRPTLGPRNLRTSLCYGKVGGSFTKAHGRCLVSEAKPSKGTPLFRASSANGQSSKLRYVTSKLRPDHMKGLRRELNGRAF